MAERLYIVPVIGDGSSKTNARRPKYFADGTIHPSSYSALDYGFEPWMLVEANLGAADDATVVSEPDAFALPFDLTANLTAGQVSNVQTKLDAINVPSGWVNTSLTWAQVVKTVVGVFSFIQRFAAVYARNTGTHPSLFGGAVTLDSTFASLPAEVRTAMLSAATSFSIDTSSLSGASTLRTILKTMADSFSNQTFSLGKLVF